MRIAHRMETVVWMGGKVKRTTWECITLIKPGITLFDSIWAPLPRLKVAIFFHLPKKKIQQSSGRRIALTDAHTASHEVYR